MDPQHGQSHRQDREQKRDEHSHPTQGKYFTSRHLTWGLMLGVILMGVAVMVWTFFIPTLRAPG